MSIFTIIVILVVSVLVMIVDLCANKVGAEADLYGRQMFEEWKKRNGIK